MVNGALSFCRTGPRNPTVLRHGSPARHSSLHHPSISADRGEAGPPDRPRFSFHGSGRRSRGSGSSTYPSAPPSSPLQGDGIRADVERLTGRPLNSGKRGPKRFGTRQPLISAIVEPRLQSNAPQSDRMSAVIVAMPAVAMASSISGWAPDTPTAPADFPS
jgi:hypothetical protein